MRGSSPLLIWLLSGSFYKCTTTHPPRWRRLRPPRMSPRSRHTVRLCGAVRSHTPSTYAASAASPPSHACATCCRLVIYHI
eukprot:830438-Prorocentrum_minimum.AAC.4